MSNNNQFETGYQDDNDNTIGGGHGSSSDGGNASGFGPSPSAPPPKKKGSKTPLIIFGVLAVAAIGGGAYMLLGGSNPPPPAPRAAPAATVDPVIEADPAAVDPAAAGEEVDPITGLPITDPAAAGAGEQPGIDPITGLPITDPALAQPQIDPSTIPGAQGGIDPITGLPITDPAIAGAGLDPIAQPGQPVAQPTSIDPATGLPVSDPNVAPAPVVDPAQTIQPTQQVPAAPVAMSGDPLAQFRDMLAPIDGRVTNLEGQVSTLNTRVDEISRRVDGLADRPRNSNSINVSQAPRRAARSTPARSQAPARSNNYVRLSNNNPRVEPPVSRVVIVAQGSPAHQAMMEDAGSSVRTTSSAGADVRDVPASAPVASAPSCDLQAIVPGRAWVKNSDGSFASYGEGDTWNGQTVGTIDPARGVKVGNRWVCN